MTPVLQVHDLQLKLGAFTLDIPRFQAAPGSVLGLVGRNGAGKTTLLQCLSGQLRPAQGRVDVLGIDPARDVVGARQRMAYMTDSQELMPLQIGTLLQVYARFYPSWDPTFAAALLRRFELDERKAPGALSKGEGTRLRLVLAMAFRPGILLLDEPATGLDAVYRRAMLETVLEVVRDPARTVIVSSHDIHDLQRIADRIVVLNRGRIVADGPADELDREGRSIEQMLAEEA